MQVYIPAIRLFPSDILQFRHTRGSVDVSAPKASYVTEMGIPSYVWDVTIAHLLAVSG